MRKVTMSASRYSTIRRGTYNLLNEDNDEDPISQATNLAIIALILLSVVAIALETVDPIAAEYEAIFWNFEVFCVAVFTIEYLLRLWTIPESGNPKYSHPVRGRLRYARDPYMLVDLGAILPFYLGGVIDLRFIRILRTIRIFRVLKTARYSDAVKTLGTVVRRKKEDLIIALTATVMLMIISASMLYFAEQAAQPDDFGSIPETLWWAVLTLSTVGYGDVVPVTFWGQVFAAMTAMLGIGLFGLPASILAAGFIEETTRRRKTDSPAEQFEGWVVNDVDLSPGKTRTIDSEDGTTETVFVGYDESAAIQGGFIEESFPTSAGANVDSTLTLKQCAKASGEGNDMSELADEAISSIDPSDTDPDVMAYGRQMLVLLQDTEDDGKPTKDWDVSESDVFRLIKIAGEKELNENKSSKKLVMEVAETFESQSTADETTETVILRVEYLEGVGGGSVRSAITTSLDKRQAKQMREELDDFIESDNSTQTVVESDTEKRDELVSAE